MGAPASEVHLIAIIRRFDLDADAKLTYAEFVAGVGAQLDFSKRQIKERLMKPSVNNREFALSPGRVPETMAVNKEDTINVHHSPLRAKRGGGALSSRREQPLRVEKVYISERDKSEIRKKIAKKTKKTKSRSKTRTCRTADNKVINTTALKKEFQSFRRAMEITNTEKTQEKSEDQSADRRFESLITSPHNIINRSSTKY